MFSPDVKASTLQKVLIGLFVLTIVLSCLSLVWYMLEKPNLKKTHCAVLGMPDSYVTEDFRFGNNQTNGIMPQLARNCTTHQNPPISGGLEVMINLTTFCGFLFLSTAICAYVFRKKLVKEPVIEAEEEEEKQ